MGNTWWDKSAGIRNLDDPTKHSPLPAWEQSARDDFYSWLKTHENWKGSIYAKRVKKAFYRKYKKEAAPKGADVSFVEQIAPRQVIYGRCRVAGVITCMHQTGPTDNPKLYDNLIITVAGHEINNFLTLLVDNIPITFGSLPGWSTGPNTKGRNFANKIYLASRLGTVSQASIQAARDEMPDIWTANDKQSNCAHVYLKLKYEPGAFPGGLPNFTFDVEGKKVYDPRSGLTVYSNNAALCAADYLIDTVYGLGVPLSGIDTASLTAAANICDQDVTLKAGGTEKRYAVNGCFDTNESRSTILQDFELSMAGDIACSNGKWKFLAGAYSSPVSITLTDDDLRSPVKLETMVTRSDNFNSVRGSYISAENDNQTTDFPPVSVNAYVDADNGVKTWQTVDLKYTTSGTMAQRIARIELEKVRRAQTLTASWGLKAYPLEWGDNVPVTLSRYGFSGKIFRVTDYDFGAGNSGEILINLVLRAIDSGVYTWTPAVDEQTVNISPATTLPLPAVVSSLANLTLTSGTAALDRRVDGTIFSRIKVSWTACNDIYVTAGGYIQIQFKKSSESDWRDFTTVPGATTEAYILDVQDGEYYDVRARAVNQIGVSGDYVTVSNHRVVGKTAPPSDVSSLSGNSDGYQIMFSWPAILDADLAAYEIRAGEDWASGPRVYLGRSNQFSYSVATAGIYSFLIKALDTSGNYSNTAAAAEVIVYSSIGATNWYTTHTYALDFLTGGYTVTNFLVSAEGSAISGPFSTTETIQQHFVNNSASTIQDLIDAGFSTMGEPAPQVTAIFEGVINFGDYLQTSAAVEFDEVYSGSRGTLRLKLSVSSNGTDYTEFIDAKTIYSKAFRYLKVRFEFTPADTSSLISIANFTAYARGRRYVETGVATTPNTQAFIDGGFVGVLPLEHYYKKIFSVVINTLEANNEQTKLITTIYNQTQAGWITVEAFKETLDINGIRIGWAHYTPVTYQYFVDGLVEDSPPAPPTPVRR